MLRARKPPLAVDIRFPDHPSFDSKHQENRIDLYSISPNPSLAAGEPRRQKRPVKPRLPSLTRPGTSGFEFEKPQGGYLRSQ